LKHWKVIEEKRGPTYPQYDRKEYPVNKLFTKASNGVFHRDSAALSEGSFPKVIGIDPGQINIWCASVYDEDSNTANEAKKVLNISRREYNKSIGLIENRKWIERGRETVYQKAELN